jgi:RNA polymerase sigma-70 factor (ECF subfamily)
MANQVEPITDIDADNEQMLVDRARLGDRHAFDLLVIRYQSRLLQLVSRLVPNQSDALDVLQDTFVKAYRSLASFRGESAFYTWLYRIAVNTAKNHVAARGKEGRDVSYDDGGQDMEHHAVFHDLGSPDAETDAQQLQVAILDAIDRLPEDLKRALTLRELEGLSYEDIAQTMQCPIGTVRSRIFRARDQVIQEVSVRFPETFL